MKNLVLMLSCLMAMCVMSCGDDATVNPPGDGSIPGTIAGRVVLFDEYGDSLSNHSGVAVKLVNENKSYSAMTDASGNYKLEKVIAGIYNLSFEKDGWNTNGENGLQFVGNGTLKKDMSLYLKKRKSILSGRVVLVDKYGRDMRDSAHLYNGIYISIAGTNLSTTPDVYGNWNIKGVEEGKISIGATKAGFEQKFDTTFYFEHDTAYGRPVNLPFNQVLVKQGTIEINLLPVKVDLDTIYDHGKIDKKGDIYISGEFVNPQDAGKTSVWIFISDRENMTKDNSDFSWTITPEMNGTYWERWRYYKGAFITGPFAKEMQNKYPSGSTVYIRAYPKVSGVLGTLSNVISFIMP